MRDRKVHGGNNGRPRVCKIHKNDVFSGDSSYDLFYRRLITCEARNGSDVSAIWRRQTSEEANKQTNNTKTERGNENINTTRDTMSQQ